MGTPAAARISTVSKLRSLAIQRGRTPVENARCHAWRVELFAFDGRGHLRTVTRDGRIVFRANYHEDGTRWLTDASNAAGATVRTVQPNDAVELRLRPGAAGLASTVRVHRSIVVTGGTGFAGQPSASAPGTYAGASMPALPRASDGLPPGAFMVLRDRLGSADVVLDHQGAVVTDYNYAPFGRMMHGKSSGMDLEYSKYTDKPDDAAIEMQFFGARYYDPRLRRFISPDPVIPGGGTDPRGFNPYAYNLNNPFRWVDPDGHAPDEPLAPGQPTSRWEAFAESAGAFVSALDLRYQAAKSAVADSASAWISDAWTSAQARMRGHLERQAASSSTPGQTDLVARPAEDVVRQEVTERGQALVGGGVDLVKDVVVGIGIGKAASGVPRVHMGKQGKHIPGHNNFEAGRSVLRADPQSLAARAGTGDQVGKIRVGRPGSKERIVFDDVIGDYVDLDGTASPTRVGIVHYSKDGIHIVPGRPQ